MSTKDNDEIVGSPYDSQIRSYHSFNLYSHDGR